MTRRIGIICGKGNFPLACAEAAAKTPGVRVYALGVRGYASEKLANLVHEMHWFSVGQVGKLIKTLKKLEIKEVTFAGKIDHVNLLKIATLDFKAMSMLKKLPDKRAETVISAVIDEFASEGIETIDPTTFLPEALVRPGVLTPNRPPTAHEQNDIDFGFPLAKIIAGADIGQTIIIKNKIVVAVEGIEGTDECIQRSAAYVDGGVTVVKVSRPRQDFRIDLPVIGLGTIETMRDAGATCLAVNAGQTLFFDRDESLALAEASNIAVVGVEMTLSDVEPTFPLAQAANAKA